MYSVLTPQTQVLSIGGLTLTLEQCDFNAESASTGFEGFLMAKSEDFRYELTRTVYGNKNTQVPYSQQLYDFSWGLNLDANDFLILQAMLEEQHLRLSNNDPDPFIRFINYRTVFSERLPRTRALSSAFALPSNLVAPVGSILYYAQHDIIIEAPIDSRETLFYNEDKIGLYTIEFTGTEAQLVNISEDI